jgi:hypothetical protein
MTRKPLLLAALASAAVLLALAAACGGDDDDGNGNGNPSGSPSGTASAAATTAPAVSGTATPGPSVIEPEICAPATEQHGLVSQAEFGGDDSLFRPGESVEITLILGNCGDNDAVLHYTTSQRYDFTIIDNETGVEVWSSDDGKTFLQVEGTETLPPATEVRYEETWDQKDRDGNQVPDGTYKVSAFSVGCSVAPRADCRFGPALQFVISVDAPTPRPTTGA